jgi:hypothetical protein
MSDYALGRSLRPTRGRSYTLGTFNSEGPHRDTGEVSSWRHGGSTSPLPGLSRWQRRRHHVSRAVEAYEYADRARRDLGLSLETLWLAYVGLGGAATLLELGWYLADGSGSFTGRQHDYVAQALNDNYVERGENHPVPYSDALGRGLG